ncbi:hypothetical protein R3P38DRAFT_2873713 [Favolaschia claudopus]|uniref:Protein kinase domain-containing protein n=1 Tax=Favolaschia claudopus TaxID=2862362 RepID=A0AAW0D6I2_9AGAR
MQASGDASGGRYKQPRHTGSFFPNASQFIINGGHFQSVTHIHQTDTSDFRTIPLGDIILGKNSGVLQVRGHTGATIRRVHSALIEGRNSTMTVAVYEGEEAEWEWYGDISPYLNLRHPNVLQLYGISTSANFYAAIFHHELVPARSLLPEYQHSPISIVYFYAFVIREFEMHGAYLAWAMHTALLSTLHCTLWIRPVTGQLCIELSRPAGSQGLIIQARADEYQDRPLSPSLPDNHLLTPLQKSQLIAFLTLAEYHLICERYLPQSDFVPISRNSTVRLGSIINRSTEPAEEVAILEDCKAEMHPLDSEGDLDAIELENGRTRIHFGSPDRPAILRQSISLVRPTASTWLSQVNYILAHLGSDMNSNHYAYVHQVKYIYRLSPSESRPLPSKAFLFLPSMRELMSYNGARLRHPDISRCWSFDPYGVRRLTDEEASELGFPEVELRMEAHGHYWDPSVYVGIREFHQAKGFDSESQDVAKQLGHPLYRLSHGVDPRLQCKLAVVRHQYFFSYNSDRSESEYESESDASALGDSDVDTEEEIILYPRA